ncbi:MAG: DUF4411 family protein [Candidatus Obscuribacterales bacterium]
MRYSADTSFFLNGWNKYYPPDNFPSIWTKIESLIAAGDLQATIEVKEELERQDDEIFSWAKNQRNLFVPLDIGIQNKIAEILTQFPNLAKAGTTKSKADPFVIALAEIHSCTVITDENMNEKLHNPKIPLVCRERGVDCIKFVELIRRENWSF